MAVESGAGPLINDQRQQLAQELSSAAQSLNRAAVAAERLARFLTDVDFEASSSEQQTQFMAALSATKDLHTTFSLSAAVEATKKRTRKDKDPDAPKRPITSYLIFQEAKRKEITAKHPELPYKEVLKLLGIEWKSMSDADKEPYIRAHEKALIQHDADVAAYEKGKGISPAAEKPKTEQVTKPVKAKDQKPAAKPKGTAAAAAGASKAAAAAPANQISESGSETSGDESSEGTGSSEEEESEAETVPPPKKLKVGAKPAPPAKTLKKDTKVKGGKK